MGFNSVFKGLKSYGNNGHFTWKPTYIYDYLPELFLELEKFQTKFVEKIETHIVCAIIFFFLENPAV